MEYYNLQGKENFEVYYQNKINGLLLNPDIMDYLDKNKIDLNEKKELNLFPNYDKKKFKTVKVLNRVGSMGSDGSEPIVPKKKQKFSKKENVDIINKRVTEVDSKLHKIDQKVSDEIVSQMSNFETRKQQKKIKRKDGTITTLVELEQEEKNKIAQQEKEKEEKLKEQLTINTEEEDNKIFNFDEKEKESVPSDIEITPRSLRRRGSSIDQNAMLKEIEEYVEKNKKEMYQALEELKISYDPEIKEAEESGFPDIAESLREDMSGELENLTAQYEEQRMKEVEAIRAKYCKKD